MSAVEDSSIELGLLLLAEQLNPTEQAAYILHEGFQYSYARVATTLEVTELQGRELVKRSLAALLNAESSGATSRHFRGLREFLTASRAGEFATLELLINYGYGRQRTETAHA